MNQTSSDRLPSRVRWGYGAGGYPASIFFLNFVFYALYFFTDLVGIGPAVAGTIISVGALWDAFSDPLIGYLSDKRNPLKGRRRPFLLWAAVPLAVFTFLSFYNPGLSPTASIIFFVVVVIGSYTFQTMVDIPYTSLAAEMTTNYDERSKLNACRNIFWNIGMFLSCAFLMIVDFFANLNGGDMNAGFAWTSLVCAVPIIPCLVITYITTKGHERTDIEIKPEKWSWSHRVLTPLKNKPFRYVTLMFALSIVAQTVNNAVGLLYYLNNLGWSDVFASTIFVISAAIGFLDTWVAQKIVDKFSKRAAWNICMGAWAFSCLALVLFFMSPETAAPPTGYFLIFLFIVCNGLGLNTQYQLALAMVPDCVEVDEYQNGERREGMYYGMTNLVQKAGAAISMFVAGMVLEGIGYDGTAAAQTASTLTGMKVMFGLGTGIFLVLSIVINMANPMTRGAHKALVKGIEDKKAGRPVDDSEFKKLYS